MDAVVQKTKNKTVAVPSKGNGHPRTFRWTRRDYHRMAEHGLFEGKRVELVNGEIIEMSPMKSAHATAIRLLLEVLRGIFGKGFIVDSQLPLSIGTTNEPEPDVSVIEGRSRDFIDAHPSTATLVVEVSDTTIQFDREVKAELYAKAGIEDYWILNVKDRCIEVYRGPVKDKKQGYIYTEVHTIVESEGIAPLAKPKSKIKVGEILP